MWYPIFYHAWSESKRVLEQLTTIGQFVWYASINNIPHIILMTKYCPQDTHNIVHINAHSVYSIAPRNN